MPMSPARTPEAPSRCAARSWSPRWAALVALVVWVPGLGSAGVPIVTGPTPGADASGTPAPAKRTHLTLDATMEGFLAYDANRPPDGSIPGRIFDPRHGELALSTVMVALEAQSGPTSGRVALWRGWTPTVIYSGEPAGSVDWSLLQEAWGAVRVGQRWTFSGGLFSSPIGLESVFARDNWCWSSSQLNLAMPFYHTGARAQFKASQDTTLEAGVYGGWTRNVASNIPSTFIVRAFGERAWGTWQLLVSGAPTRPEHSVANVGAVRGWLVDGFVTAQANDAWEFAAQAQAGAETWNHDVDGFTVAPWAALALYARRSLGTAWKLTVRAETFWQSDTTALIGGNPAAGQPSVAVGQLWWPTSLLSAGTLSLQWRAVHALLVRLDLRVDSAADAIFVTHDGLPSKLRPTASLGIAWTL